MAVASSFKQTCPSCEAQVPVKDRKLIGKKIDCPQCKYRFVVEDPAKHEPPEEVIVGNDDGGGFVDEAPEEEPAPAKSKGNGKAIKAKTPAKKKSRGEEPVEEAEGPSDEEEPKKEKKPARGNKKMTVGLALAGVGFVVLVAAAYFILFNKAPTSQPQAAVVPVNPTPPAQPPDEQAKPDEEPKPEQKDPEGKKPPVPTPTAAPAQAAPPEILGSPAGPEFTNLLPNNTEHVAHIDVQALLDPQGLLKNPAFASPIGFSDDEMRARVGFSVLHVDSVIRAQRFTAPAWSYTLVHSLAPFNIKTLTETLGLRPAAPIKAQTYYEVTKPNAWFDGLARMSFGVPVSLRDLPLRTAVAPTFVYLHNPQTLIVADEAPLKEFLTLSGQFRLMQDAPKAPEPAKVEPPAPGKGDPKAPPPSPAPLTATVDLGGTYLTIDPKLKAILDRMEQKTVDTTEKILFSSVTDLDAARADIRHPDYRDRIYWHPARIWDLRILLKEKTPRLRKLGTALVQRDPRTYQYRNELECLTEADAKEFTKEVTEKAVPPVVRFFEQALAHKVGFVKGEPAKVEPGKGAAPSAVPARPAMAPPGETEIEEFNRLQGMKETQKAPEPMARKEDAPDLTGSRITLTRDKAQVEWKVDLSLDPVAMGRAYAVAEMLVAMLKGEVDVAFHSNPRYHLLAQAAKMLSEHGLADRELPPQAFPSATLKRTIATGRSTREPNNRVSFLAALLPYLGRESLFQKIQFDNSWRDPLNLIPARVIVPEFQDPRYPAKARYASHPELGQELAATHIVGLAGVGLDAADYPPGDPATAHKRGVFGYDRSATLAEIDAGRGRANTALLIQVPHDGLVGVTPWIEGGGATVRGVPEKNSIAPFVLSVDRAGKPIEHNGRKGTFAIMADGSVRFISKDISDATFQAMCTVKGPAPDGFDLSKSDQTALIPPPKAEPAGKKDIPGWDLAELVKRFKQPELPKKATPAAKLDDIPAIEAVDLVKEYQASRTAAEKKHRDKTVTVKGKVGHGKRGQDVYLESGLRSLLPNADDTETTVILLRPRVANAFASIPPNTVIWVRGRCTGFDDVLDVVFEDCEVLRQ